MLGLLGMEKRTDVKFLAARGLRHSRDWKGTDWMLYDGLAIGRAEQRSSLTHVTKLYGYGELAAAVRFRSLWERESAAAVCMVLSFLFHR